MATDINVRVARVPGKVEDVTLRIGQQTVEDALRAAGITNYKGSTITVNEREVDLGVQLTDGATVLVANRSVKGAFPV